MLALRHLALAALAAVSVFAAHADKTTVCTITVNSPDERDTIRRRLGEEQYKFVELVERGRSDWLDSACHQDIQCDVLVISGHFAGTEFYSSRFDASESLPVDEMDRVACSASCPGLFSRLKEVYLFGCDTLKPEPAKSATPEIVRQLVRSGKSRGEAERLARALSERYAESNLEHMRRIFADVPVIYGFSSLAPYGRVAGPMLERYFDTAPEGEIGSGQRSATLLSLFGPASMTVVSGMRPSDPRAQFRDQSCRYFDERVTLAQKLESIHGTLGGASNDVRMSFDRIERFFAALPQEARAQAEAENALAALAGDRSVRKRYLAIVHDTSDPALRVRMIALARTVGWLNEVQQRTELATMIGELLASHEMGFPEVDLICDLNREHALDSALQRLGGHGAARKPAQAAALACLGSDESRAAVLNALASANEGDVQTAQAYLRHRPIADPDELRKVALAVTRMPVSGAQARAIETLARHHLDDRDVLQELMRLFARTQVASVQQAIAEVFIRSDLGAIDTAEVLATVRRHRVRAAAGADLVDALVRMLE